MSGKLALIGGDEFRRGCEAMDEAILKETGKSSPVVLIVPTAAAFENPARAADNGVKYISPRWERTQGRSMVLNNCDAESADLASEIRISGRGVPDRGQPGLTCWNRCEESARFGRDSQRSWSVERYSQDPAPGRW